MSPLYTEVHIGGNNWHQVGVLNPGDNPGSMSDNRPDGSRQVYLFECSADDSHSLLYRSKAGIDAEIGVVRVMATDGLEEIKCLTKGDKPYSIRVQTDGNPRPTLVRFIHR